MKILKRIGLLLLTLVVAIGFLDTFGGYFMDGPLGPIPGGRMQGEVSRDADPDWSSVEEVIELEIRPDKPWSLSVWNAVVDGELYVPSANGENRRWPGVALEDPRVRVRTGGKIYERTIVRVTDPEVIVPVRRAIGERYGLDGDPNDLSDGVWVFRLDPREE